MPAHPVGPTADTQQTHTLNNEGTGALDICIDAGSVRCRATMLHHSQGLLWHNNAVHTTRRLQALPCKHSVEGSHSAVLHTRHPTVLPMRFQGMTTPQINKEHRNELNVVDGAPTPRHQHLRRSGLRAGSFLAGQQARVGTKTGPEQLSAVRPDDPLGLSLVRKRAGKHTRPVAHKASLHHLALVAPWKGSHCAG